jgi:hypothetical protein
VGGEEADVALRELNGTVDGPYEEADAGEAQGPVEALPGGLCPGDLVVSGPVVLEWVKSSAYKEWQTGQQRLFRRFSAPKCITTAWGGTIVQGEAVETLTFASQTWPT